MAHMTWWRERDSGGGETSAENPAFPIVILRVEETTAGPGDTETWIEYVRF